MKINNFFFGFHHSPHPNHCLIINLSSRRRASTQCANAVVLIGFWVCAYAYWCLRVPCDNCWLQSPKTWRSDFVIGCVHKWSTRIVFFIAWSVRACGSWSLEERARTRTFDCKQKIMWNREAKVNRRPKKWEMIDFRRCRVTSIITNCVRVCVCR